MKKESKKVIEDNLYDVINIVGNTALVNSTTGEKRLINIKTNGIIVSFEKDTQIDYSSKGLFIQYKVFDNKTYVTIYDAYYEELIFNNWYLCNEIKNDGHIMVLQNPDNKEYYLFDEEKYRTNHNIFNIGYDEVEVNEKFLIIGKGSKKAMYSIKYGFTTPVEYDDIKSYKFITIFKKGNKKFFTLNRGNVKDSSQLFDDVECDNKNESIVYCKNNSTISIYYVGRFGCQELFITPNYDEIKLLEYNDCYSNKGKEEFIFLVKKDNRYGVITGNTGKKLGSTPILRTLLDIDYDKIDYKYGSYYLHKGNKVGLFVGNHKKNYRLEPIYDKIVKIAYTDNYILFNKDNSSIINLLNKIVILKNCNIISILDDAIIFKKNGKMGLLRGLKNDDFQRSEGLDDIKHLGGTYFLITYNGNQGVIYGNSILIEPVYKSIDVNYNLDSVNPNPMIFALKKENGEYDLAKLDRKLNKLDYLYCEGFNDIKLYKFIIILRNLTNTYIYSYNGSLLTTLPLEVQIDEILVDGINKYLYKINDIYYVYTDGIFEKVPSEIVTLYMSAYECEYGTVVVNSYDENTYNDECKAIESSSINETLHNFYENNQSLQEKYPKLIKK